MLPPFIIDQIRQREEKERAKPQERVLELPLPFPMDRDLPKEESDRGVVIIDLGA